MIEITDSIVIPENDLQIDFVQSSGPGGQKVNKVASQVQLRYNTNSTALPDEVRLRLLKIARNRITEEGFLIIEARRYRSQERNRVDAINRLVELVRRAAVKPKTRKATQPSHSARQSRLDEKKRRSQVKRQRRSRRDLDFED